MKPRDIRCLACGESYAFVEGCDVCEPAKREIEWPAFREGESESLGIVSRTLRILTNEIEATEKSLKKAATAEAKSELLKVLNSLASSVSKLAQQEIRLQESEAKSMKAMTYDDKVDLVLSWFQELPTHVKLSLSNRMKDDIARDKATKIFKQAEKSAT